MEQNRKLKNKLMYIWSNNFQQRSQELIMGKDYLLNKWCWDSHMQERNWTFTL